MLEVGKTYELNSGDVHECTRTFKRQDGEVVYVLDEVWYHQDGTCGCFEDMPDSRYHVRRCVDDNTPPLWRDMTDAEKGALLLAKHEGKVIEYYSHGIGWEADRPNWMKSCAYRIKPEPKVETVEYFAYCDGSDAFIARDMSNPTHRFTLIIRDGKVDPVAQVEEL